MSKEHLPQQLRTLVKRSVAMHGDVIRQELGTRMYARIEAIRRDMASLRGQSAEKAHRCLEATRKRLASMSERERFEVTHAFGLMLELMNACENAYRSHRLGMRDSEERPRSKCPIVYVLTAHPTEARSPLNIAIFNRIQKTLAQALQRGFESQEAELRHCLELAWRLMTARSRKPTVGDEAEHLYSILLRSEILDALLECNMLTAPVFVRTWVGGDKDGHPGVDERAMLRSMQLSRTRLAAYVRAQLDQVRESLAVLGAGDTGVDKLRAELAGLQAALRSLKNLKAADGRKLGRLHDKLRRLASVYRAAVGAPHPALLRLQELLRMFPALIVPLELREASDAVVLAASGSGRRFAIARMLRTVARVSAGTNPRYYVRGFIISMASSMEHIEAASRLAKKAGLGLTLPIVPLFEQREALERAPELVREAVRKPEFRRAILKHWGGHFEVMLGYSDSAKEVGVLGSRVAIARATRELDAALRAEGMRACFFHGSGGSVDRGGGSIEEQTAWWPPDAFDPYKATVQGEMVDRTFSSPEITRSGIEKIALRAANPPRVSRASAPATREVQSFASRVSSYYQAKLADPAFLEVIQKATAYRYLSVLRMGSRPSRRSRAFSLGSLRAIPWVLSWTQTRVLFPTWWGVGSAWQDLGPGERKPLRRAFERDPLFRSYVKALGFTLAKVELPVWRIYLEQSELDPELARRTYREFEREFHRALAFVRAMSGSRDPVWFRPWLGDSIRLRSPMIHPLNLLQILALEECDSTLIRETATGIASGMLTTG